MKIFPTQQILTIALLWLCISMSLAAEQSSQRIVIRMHNLEKFSPSEQSKIQHWMDVVVHANDITVGRLPFPIDVYFYLRPGKEPVPWANTWRDGGASVHMYIDVQYELQEFVDDWTAYHELSHFALPYLGPENRWFAEGFASFMQYQYMSKAGVMEGDAKSRYQLKIAPFLSQFQRSEPTLQMIQKLFQKRQYKPAYWASAWYFITVDLELQQAGKSLVDIVSEYLLCCRLGDKSLVEVIEDWDKLAGKPLFSNKLAEWKTKSAQQIYPAEAKW